jgi:predicted nicotinamide N-methyase
VRIRYALSRQTETIAGIPLEIECLESLDRTIDELFAELAKSGDERMLEELCPYFGTVWPSARALAERVGRLGSTLAGQRFLEVGCGLALPSLIATRLGARVTATDFHPEVPIFLERNLELNQMTGLDYVRVDWRGGFPELGLFDHVVGSDVLYERGHAPLLAAVVERYLAPGGQALIADPARPYLQAFLDEMGSRGFRHETCVVATPGKEVFVVSLAR